MAFFTIKDCDVNEVERGILAALKNRPIREEQDAELWGRCTVDYFMERYCSRPTIKFKMFFNRLPPWVYAVCKIFPFYTALRKQLLMSLRKK